MMATTKRTDVKICNDEGVPKVLEPVFLLAPVVLATLEVLVDEELRTGEVEVVVAGL